MRSHWSTGRLTWTRAEVSAAALKCLPKGLLRGVGLSLGEQRRTGIVNLVRVPDGGDDVFEQMKRRPSGQVGSQLRARQERAREDADFREGTWPGEREGGQSRERADGAKDEGGERNIV